MIFSQLNLRVASLLISLLTLTACGGSGEDDEDSTNDSSSTSGAYSVGGTITGLTGTDLVLQNNGGANLAIAAGATSFSFAGAANSGGTYNVTVLTQPTNPAQTCIVNDGFGSVTGNVNSISITCIPSVAPNVTVSYGSKQVTLSWPAVPGATYYEVTVGGYVQFDGTVSATSYTVTYGNLTDIITKSYRVRACNAAGCKISNVVAVVSNQTIQYLKASNTGSYDAFSTSIALSADGSTLAVGASFEDSNATGINGNQADNSAVRSGAVYVYTRSGSSWSQQAYVKASNTDSDDGFGDSVALSSDGNTLVVGAPGEASNATGINGNQADNRAAYSGAVYVYTRSGSNWSQQAYVKASNTGSFDDFGHSVALSSDGNTLVVGAPGEASNATGINGNQADNSAANSGAVYVYTHSGSNWSQQAYVKASNTQANDLFGHSVALSSNGNTLAVGAYGEQSNATGINGAQADNSADESGAVYVYTRSGSSWSQQAYVKASNTQAGDNFGRGGLGLSGDGDTLAVAALEEDSNATGIDGNQADNSAANSGAVYVYTRSGSSWSQQAYIKASNAQGGDGFGGFAVSFALSSDGNTLAVGAAGEDSNATGIDGNQADNSVPGAGAVYIYTRSSGGNWSQRAYVKASNTQSNDLFGHVVALSSDASTLAVGAYLERSNATGINGDQANNDAISSGAVYVY